MGAVVKRVALLAACVLSAMQAGCFYCGSQACFHSSQDASTDKWPPIEFEIDKVRFGGDFKETATIVLTFVPIVPAFIASGNPHHLSLWIDGDCAGADEMCVTSVSLRTPDGKTLFEAGQTDGLAAPGEVSEPGKNRPIFSPNPAFEGPGRRRSSRNGWPNSRPVKLSSSCDKLLLRMTYKRKQPGGGLGPEQTAEVTLTRYRHGGMALLTDSIFLTTGSISN